MKRSCTSCERQKQGGERERGIYMRKAKPMNNKQFQGGGGNDSHLPLVGGVRALAAASFWRQFILFMNASRDIRLAGAVNGSPGEGEGETTPPPAEMLLLFAQLICPSSSGCYFYDPCSHPISRLSLSSSDRAVVLVELDLGHPTRQATTRIPLVAIYSYVVAAHVF